MKIKSICKSITDLIFPSSIYCIACGNIIDETRPYALCNECMVNFRWANAKTCKVCGKLLSESNVSELCYDCQRSSHCFDKGFTCCQYGMYEKKVIFNLKYKRKTYIAKIVAEIMNDRMLIEDIKYDIVIPVPIHKKRLRERGFNQAELITKYYAKLKGVEYDSNCMIRTKQTDASKKLNPEERKLNLLDAFEITEHGRSRLFGNNVLIIDDIYTTGATADALSEILKGEGANRIYFLSFAAGGDLRKNC